MENKILTAYYEGKSLEFIAEMYSMSPKNVYSTLKDIGVVLPDITVYDYGLPDLNKLAGMIVQVGSSYSYCGVGRYGRELAEAYQAARKVPMTRKIRVPEDISIEEHSTIIRLASEGKKPAMLAKMTNRSMGEIYASIGGLYED